MSRSVPFFLAVVLAAPAAAQSTPPAAAPAQAPVTLPDSVVIATGRRYADWFFNGQADSLYAHLTPETQKSLGTPAALMRGRDELAGRAGSEVEVVAEKANRRKGLPQYWRASRYELYAEEPIVVRFLLDGERRVAGIGMGPESETPPPD